MALFIPGYFLPISHYAEIIKHDNIVFETDDNFQKRTYRNRSYIYGANGKQQLSIPVKHPKINSRKKTKDALVENDLPWQSQHLKSLQSAYKNAPFFDYFEFDLIPFFNKNYKYLLDVLIDTHLFAIDALDKSQKISKTDVYQQKPVYLDLRNLTNVKQENYYTVPHYAQMFDDKHGFISNLSILDLLFMEGPNAINILEKVKN